MVQSSPEDLTIHSCTVLVVIDSLQEQGKDDGIVHETAVSAAIARPVTTMSRFTPAAFIPSTKMRVDFENRVVCSKMARGEINNSVRDAAKPSEASPAATMQAIQLAHIETECSCRR
jgi:hypothetical protein